MIRIERVLIACCVLAMAAVRAETVAVPPTYFGMHIHRAVQTQPWLPHGDKVTPWPSAKFGAWRLWDAYVNWPGLEPARDRWNFATLDKYVAIAELTGVEVMLPLGLSPTWASARPDERSGYRPGNAAEPRDLDDWRKYVRTVATRYKNRIHMYELWNEVSDSGYFSGSMDIMIELARIAYEVIKDVDPKATIVSPSVTGVGRHLKWLDEYLAKGGGRYADVIAYHFYVPKGKPEDMLPIIRQVKDIMHKERVADKPLWNTETGWWIGNRAALPRTGSAGADWLRLDEARAAAFVSRALVLAWSEGVSRFYWYAWDNIDMGLIEPDTQEPKPAARAYEQTRKWLTGKIVEQCKTEGDAVWTCVLRSPAGARAWMVWRTDGQTAAYAISRDWQIVNVEPLGGAAQRLDTSQREISVGEAPLLMMQSGYVPER